FYTYESITSLTLYSSLPPLICYTDGSCQMMNGKGISSGIGIYFGPSHPLNTSKKLNGPHHDSGIAEIIAVQTALKKIHGWAEFSNKPVIIRTDYLESTEDSLNCTVISRDLQRSQIIARFKNSVR
ncbi:hypothetical protein PENTCL1PPCAC_2497, partial [Pristionchus entomophagus]